ncbi:MAG: class I SAM-dependent methyltransferase [Phycisphaerae bacterium]
MSSNENAYSTASDSAQDGLSSWARAEWYDGSINWNARIDREIPVLTDVFGAPGAGGLLDAGCGTGHQAIALARRGYKVVGADLSEEMLAIATRHADGVAGVRFIRAGYSELVTAAGTGFDGVYCLGNALAAAGSKAGVRDAIGQFAACLRPGGRLFVQILNFRPMRSEMPCVKGPRVVTVDGVEYVSVRHFHFDAEAATVTGITLWQDGGWKQRASSGRLYPIERDELVAMGEQAGMRIDDLWANYQRTRFDGDKPGDLILVATRVG